MHKLQIGFKDPKMSRDDLINHQLKAVMKRYVSPYESKEEEKRVNYLKSIGQIKNKYPELKYTDMKHSQIKQYELYLRVSGANKSPYVPPPENPVHQKQIARQIIKEKRQSKQSEGSGSNDGS